MLEPQLAAPDRAAAAERRLAVAVDAAAVELAPLVAALAAVVEEGEAASVGEEERRGEHAEDHRPKEKRCPPSSNGVSGLVYYSSEAPARVYRAPFAFPFAPPFFGGARVFGSF